MTREDKDLLLKDLCARLPYGVYTQIADTFKYSIVPAETHLLNVDNYSDILCLRYKGFGKRLKKAISERIEDIAIMPYLRPMSSMTEEERIELSKITHCNILYINDAIGVTFKLLDDATFLDNVKAIDYLNSHYFDYRGLIEKGLALEAPKTMYKRFGDMKTVIGTIEHKDRI